MWNSSPSLYKWGSQGVGRWQDCSGLFSWFMDQPGLKFRFFHFQVMTTRSELSDLYTSLVNINYIILHICFNGLAIFPWNNLICGQIKLWRKPCSSQKNLNFPSISLSLFISSSNSLTQQNKETNKQKYNEDKNK